MKCPVCSSEVKELYNLNAEADESNALDVI